jgi:hypothetical protein
MTIEPHLPGHAEDPLGFDKLRFDRARERVRRLMGEELAHAPLRLFVTNDDQHLPKRLLGKSVTELLMQMSAAEILEIPGVGPTRLRRLLTVVERALLQLEMRRESRSAHHEPEPISDSPPPVAITDPPEPVAGKPRSAWQTYFDLLYRHRLDHLPIGMFTESIRDLPQGLWDKPLSVFLNPEPLGPNTRRKVELVVTQLASFLDSVDPNTFASLPTLPVIRQLAAWVERAGRLAEPPTRVEFVGGFCEPLLSQIEADFSADVSTICALKVGLRSAPETLKSISTRFGVTRERIRQHLATVSDALRIRWPDGPSRLKRLLDVLNASRTGRDVQELAERIAKDLFDTTQVSDIKVAEAVSEAWRAAGRQRLTPMTAEEMKEWSARTLSEIDPDTVVDLIRSRFPTCERNGSPIWFSDSAPDKVLWVLTMKAGPASVTDILGELHAAHAVLNEGKTLEQILATTQEAKVPRSLAEIMGRDPRFVEVEDKQWLPAEACGFFRANGVWSIRLSPLATIAKPLESLPLSQVITFLVNGMLQRGIVDATSAGVHRFIDELLGQLFGASLPPLITPYVLADMLVVHADGVIRHMRRRRLQWEAVAPGLQAWGKRRWVGHVVAEAGRPIVLAELDTALRAFYQDYADYVIQQIHYKHYSIDDDAGGADKRVTFLTHLGPGIPIIAAPIDWQLDVAANPPNVSPGVLEVVAQLRAKIAAGDMDPRSLRLTPWLAELISGEE